jgi:hypothetical protein
MGQPGMPGSQFPGEDALIREVRDLRRLVQQFAAANVLATAGISAAEGGVLVNGFMQFKREDGAVGVEVDPATGTFTVYDAAGTAEVARFGELLETAPGEYGVEVDVGGTWVRLGAQAVTWDLVSGKPGWSSNPASIDGTNITGTVPAATTATTAAEADGTTTTAFNRDIAGIPGTYKAMWMHSTNVIGYNTSDEKYKKNIRDLAITDEQFMALRAVLYDRKATGADDYTPAVQVDEIGLIAGEVEAAISELALKFNGEVDSVFYERVGVVLLPFVQRLLQDYKKLDARISALEAGGS